MVLTPIAVEPSLMASREYSTWNSRPSGENVLELGLELQSRKRINVDRRTLSRDLVGILVYKAIERDGGELTIF